MYKALIVSVVFILSMTLSACATNPYGGYSAPSKETQGAVAGGVIGGLLGSTVGDGRGTVWAAAAGTLIGALAGAHIGRQLDGRDRYYAGQTLETAPTGATKEWVNPDSGTAYSVTPTHTYESQGTPCREFTMDAEVGGQSEQVYGTACRQADGSWKMSV
ncbi:MAG: RT0821/Lpp0805 family surface protein [Pseudomonadota bacterium]